MVKGVEDEPPPPNQRKGQEYSIPWMIVCCKIRNSRNFRNRRRQIDCAGYQTFWRGPCRSWPPLWSWRFGCHISRIPVVHSSLSTSIFAFAFCILIYGSCAGMVAKEGMALCESFPPSDGPIKTTWRQPAHKQDGFVALTYCLAQHYVIVLVIVFVS